MANPPIDSRSADRRAQDEQIANEPQMAPLILPADTLASPVEVHLARQTKRPLALAGIVENGLVRPVDPAVKLVEHSRVIIVAAE